MADKKRQCRKRVIKKSMDGLTILKRIRASELPCEKVYLVSEKDNQKHEIHSIVLAAASEYFSASLGPNFQEGKKDQFLLEGTDSETVEAIVDFCYSGCIDLTVDNVAKFLAIASSVDIDLLEKQCRKFYNENLSEANCIDALIDADRYSYSDLRQRAFDLICESFEMVPATEIHKLDHSLLRELLKSDKMQAHCDLVFGRLFEWFQNRRDEREKHMPGLLKLIRLNRLELKLNSTSVLSIADEYNFADLRQRALDIVCSRFEILPATEIHRLNHRVLHDLLKSDQIRASEDLVFKRLFEWFQIEEDERRQHMPELLKSIRLNHITPGFLSDTVHDVFESFQCSTLLLAEYKSRTKSQRSNVDFRRFRSTFLLITRSSFDGAISIEKYNNVLTRIEDETEIAHFDRAYFNTIVHKNQLIVLGGSTNYRYLNCVSSYDLDSLQETVLPPMIKARGGCVPFLSGNFIYMFGGFAQNNISSCERFDTEAKEWKEIRSMNIPRCNAAVAASNGYIYVAGGGFDDRSVELYDPKCDEWTEIKPMNEGRHSFALIEFNGFLYAMGGGAETVEKYDPYKICWTEIGSFDGSKYVSSGIKVDGQTFVIMYNGRFGEVKIDEGNNCTFIPLAKSKYESVFLRNRFIYQN